MAPADVAKVLIIGPKGTGKSPIANFLAGNKENLSERNSLPPTIGVRILEFEKELKGNISKLDVQLWDVSGDHSFEPCWPAIMKDAVGVILVYNPDNPVHLEEINLWHEWFVKNPSMDASQCLAFAHRLESASNKAAPPKGLTGVQIVDTNFERGNIIRSEFDTWLERIADVWRKSKK